MTSKSWTRSQFARQYLETGILSVLHLQIDSAFLTQKLAEPGHWVVQGKMQRIFYKPDQIINCCVFWPAFRCLQPLKADQNTFFSRFQPILLILNLFSDLWLKPTKNVWKCGSIFLRHLLLNLKCNQYTLHYRLITIWIPYLSSVHGWYA